MLGDARGSVVDKVTLHCCNFMWIKGGHPCAKVRKALDEAGVPYEMAHNPQLRGRRAALLDKTGQNRLPAIEFGDGRTYREESKDMAARIAAGKLFES
jgi:glutathione S-transferase